MSKELEALEQIIEKTGCINDTCVHLPKCLKDNKCRYNDDNLMCPDYEIANSIKQALLKAQEQEKVLEIIKKKEVDVAYLMCLLRNYNTNSIEIASMYNRANVSQFQLLPREIDLLKRWLNVSSK